MPEKHTSLIMSASNVENHLNRVVLRIFRENQ
jgi:hypothetical protein